MVLRVGGAFVLSNSSNLNLGGIITSGTKYNPAASPNLEPPLPSIVSLRVFPTCFSLHQHGEILLEPS